MVRVLSSAGAERRISFCTSVLFRIFLSLNYVQLLHLHVTSVTAVRGLLPVSGNLPSPYSGCQMTSARFLRNISMCPPNLTAWRRGWPNRTAPYRVSSGHCIITSVHGLTEFTWARIHNAMFLLSSQAHLNLETAYFLWMDRRPVGLGGPSHSCAAEVAYRERRCNCVPCCLYTANFHCAGYMNCFCSSVLYSQWLLFAPFCHCILVDAFRAAAVTTYLLTYLLHGAESFLRS
jgi:hypothetical protein